MSRQSLMEEIETAIEAAESEAQEHWRLAREAMNKGYASIIEPHLTHILIQDNIIRVLGKILRDVQSEEHLAHYKAITSVKTLIWVQLDALQRKESNDPKIIAFRNGAISSLEWLLSDVLNEHDIGQFQVVAQERIEPDGQ